MASKFYVSGSNLIPKVATWIPKFIGWWRGAGTSTQVLSVGNDGTITSLDTVLSSLTVGDFGGSYGQFVYSANWINNLMLANQPVGTLGDVHYGIFDDGSAGKVEYTQSGWIRIFADSLIKTSTTLGNNIKGWLVTTSTWNTSCVAVSTTAGYGDVGETYTEGNYFYRCIANNGTNHTWLRTEGKAGIDVVLGDVSYMFNSSNINIVSSTPQSLTQKNYILICNLSSAMVVNLPVASTSNGYCYVIKNKNSGQVSVTPNGSDTIDGSNTAKTLNQYDSITIICDGITWNII